jgi:hypothetical protein
VDRGASRKIEEQAKDALVLPFGLWGFAFVLRLDCSSRIDNGLGNVGLRIAARRLTKTLPRAAYSAKANAELA